MQNSINHAPGLDCKVCPRLLSEVVEDWPAQLADQARIDSPVGGHDDVEGSLDQLTSAVLVRVSGRAGNPLRNRKRTAHAEPFDSAHAEPFDSAQDMLVECIGWGFSTDC